jgi:hypothetical protein
MLNLRNLDRLLLVVVLFAIVGSSRVARAQDDEVVEDENNARPVNAMAAVVVQQAQNFDQMDQWVFGRLGGSAGARTKLDSSLLLRIDDLDRVCRLSEAQKNKLRLAGRGDIKRFFDRVEALKRKFQQAQNDPNNNIWQEIQPLQVELNAGLFGDESIYTKTIRRTLSPDQETRFESLARERTNLRFKATVEWFVAHLDKGLGLTEDQRQRFIELLVHETRAPRKFGQGDYWYLMLRMAGLPEAKLKPIFDAPQWRLLSRQFVQAKAMTQRLKAAGVFADDDEIDQPPAGRPPAPGAAPAVPDRKVVKPAQPVRKTGS